MSPLFTYKGKLLQKNGKLANNQNCCCDNEYGIMICNSNSILDDNFDVFLNNNKIGVHLAPNGIIGGEFWVTDNAITRQILTCAQCDLCNNDFELCITCAGSNDIIDGIIPKNLFVQGLNTLRMFNTQANGSGNYGRVWVFKFSKNPPAVKAIPLSATYSGNNGQSFFFNFNL